MSKTCKLYFLIAFVSLASFLFTFSCNNGGYSNRIKVKSIKFDTVNHNIKVGKTLDLSQFIEIQPADATNKKIGYRVVGNNAQNFTDYIAFEQGGLVTGRRKTDNLGLKIEAYSIDNPSAKASCYVFVNPITIEKIAIYCEGSETVMNVGDKKTLKVKVYPENAEYQTLSYNSNQPTVISINPTTGEMTAMSKGNARINVTSNDGSNVFQSVDMSVDDAKIPCAGISIADTYASGINATLNTPFTIPNTKDGTLTLLPDSGTNATTTKSVTVSVSDSSYLTLDLDNNDYPMATGIKKTTSDANVYLIFTANDDKRISQNVRVTIN